MTATSNYVFVNMIGRLIVGDAATKVVESFTANTGVKCCMVTCNNPIRCALRVICLYWP